MEPQKKKKRFVRKKVQPDESITDGFTKTQLSQKQKEELKIREKQLQNQARMIPVKAQEPPKFKKASSFVKKEEHKKNEEQEENIQNAGDRIQASDCRKLKKYLKEITPQFESAEIKYYKDAPSVFVEYEVQGKRNKYFVRDMLKACKKMTKDRTLIQNIYSTLYNQVSKKYHDIIIFGLEQAKQKKVKFQQDYLEKIKSPKYRDEILFYFIQKGKIMKFVLFDYFLSSVQFNTKFIEEKQIKHERQWKIYQQFQKQFLKNINEEQKERVFGVEEIDSDQETRKNKPSEKKTLEQIKQRLFNIIFLDVSDIEEKIEEKNEYFNSKVNDANEKQEQLLQKLAEQIGELQANLDNFNETKEKVKQIVQLQFQSEEEEKRVHLMLLKKMIIAEKQLSSRLPILARKREIFQLLDKHNLIILQGQTGSGKSTQLPQMLCQYYKIFQKEKSLPVLVTQPRKLATRTLAERVATEMEESLHNFVDYQASENTTINENAKIIFKLDRLVLDELTIDPNLSRYCCLVIDEAHQRTISIDVILGLIKSLLQKRSNFKIIVTSASMDTKLFKDYFKTQIMKVSGRMYPVQEIFRPYEHEKQIRKKIQRVIDNDLLENTSKMVPQYAGHVLVFCSGVDEINTLVQTYRNKLNPRVFKIYPLHGKLAAEEQRQVFSHSKQHKIIFATRIAETSITIDGIKVVIDPGEDREMVFDQKTKISSLKLKDISKSSAKQRAGRAGRTNQGFCFRLYSEKQKKNLREGKTPEIQNMALDTLVLRLKSLKIEDVINFPYLSEPSKDGLSESLRVMTLMGCLDTETKKITEIGKILVKIPIQPFLARAIIQALLFEEAFKDDNILSQMKMPQEEIYDIFYFNFKEDIIKILCMVIHASNIFYIRQKDRERAEKNKFQQFSHKQGDFFFFLKIYKKYTKLFEQKKNHELKDWATKNFISLKTLRQVRDLQREILGILRYFKLKQENIKNELKSAKAKLRQCEKAQQILLSSLITSFVANICIYSENPFIGYTLISQQLTLQLYGTTSLSLQGINPKWIVCYDLITNAQNKTFCKVAQQVKFDFMRCHVNEFIFKEFRLNQIQKANFYYKRITKQLPSLIYLEISEDYRRKDYDAYSKALQFLNRFTLYFRDGQNIIDFFYETKKFKEEYLRTSQNLKKILENKKSFRDSENPQQVITEYIKQIQSKFKKSLHYNYLNNIYIHLSDGFKLEGIDFKNKQYQFQIDLTGEASAWFYYYCSAYGDISQYPGKVVISIMEEQNLKDFEMTLKYLQPHLSSLAQKKINIKQELVDKRKKVPQIKMFIRFSAGQPAENFLLSYEKRTFHHCKQMLDCIIKGVKQRIGVGDKKLAGYKFSLTKHKNAINCFHKRGQFLDEFQISQELLIMRDTGAAGYNFEIPKSVKGFRQPDLIQSLTPIKDWQTRVKNLLRSVKIEEEDATIRVWGYPSKKQKGNLQNQIQNKMLVDLHAEVKAFNLKNLQQFKERYDGKTKILGTQKMHVTFDFQQSAAVTNEKIFEALRDEFDYKVHIIQSESQLVRVQHFKKRFRKQTKVFIKVRSISRDLLMGPVQKLNKLFSPKIVRLQPTEFRFLEKTNEGEKIMDQIQYEYEYKIYFGFDKRSKTIKLFCEDKQQKQIISQLKQKMKRYKYYSEFISYRGKNLHKVIEIIDKKKEELRNKRGRGLFLQYQIKYQKRQIQITADIQNFNYIKNQIFRLVDEHKGECDICCDILQQPFRMFNCGHTYCWSCLSSYVKEMVNQPGKQYLDCPSFEDCKKYMNIQDIRRLLTQEDFYKICDLQISRFVEKDQKYHCCFTGGCEQIFLKAQTLKQGSFECEVCGKWYCLKCKQPHKGYTCEDWKNHIDPKTLHKLGIKNCPNCKTGIQKNEGCQHMTCPKCKVHFCWNCSKMYKTADECYDHLAKECGGIFA